MPDVVNLKQKLSLFSEQWSPRVVASLNDYHFKIVKLDGEFVWHKHDETDEAFLVIEGEMDIALRDCTVHLEAGELFVVPKGIEHKPMASTECHALLTEPGVTVNTGNAGGERTAETDVWI